MATCFRFGVAQTTTTPPFAGPGAGAPISQWIQVTRQMEKARREAVDAQFRQMAALRLLPKPPSPIAKQESKEFEIPTFSKQDSVKYFKSIPLETDNKSSMKIARFANPQFVGGTLQGCSIKALDESDKSEVFIKTCLIKCWKSKTNFEGVKLKTEDILKESTLLKQLDHKNIVKMIKFYSDELFFYLVTEWCSGGRLFDFVKILHGHPAYKPTDKEQKIIDALDNTYNPCPVEYNRLKIVRGIWSQLVDVIDWLHSRGVCHLDISLENIMLMDQPTEKTVSTVPRIKIIDFGMAKTFKPDSQVVADRLDSYSFTPYENKIWIHDQVVGKMGYRALEVTMCGLYKNSAYDPQAADIWSMGVVLWLLVFGKYPFVRGAGYQEPLYKAMITGNLIHALVKQNRLNRITFQAFQVLHGIFQVESLRIAMPKLKRMAFSSCSTAITTTTTTTS